MTIKLKFVNKVFILVYSLILATAGSLFSQESRVKVMSEFKINDSMVIQTLELSLFNNSGNPFCIATSLSFLSKVPSRDTVVLASRGEKSSCKYYGLNISEEDTKYGTNDIPSYPIVLNNRTSFITYVSVTRNIRCDNTWIEVNYISDNKINYCDLSASFNSKSKKWDAGLHFKELKIAIPKPAMFLKE
jgi:hypothetical protein